MRTLFTALVALCYVGSPAQAQEFTPVYVATEDDDDTCEVSNVSIVAVVESELRYNRIPVGTRAQAIADEALTLRVNTTAVFNRGVCAVGYNLEMSNYQEIVLSVTGEKRWATTVLCQKGGLMTGPAFDLQSRLNAEFRDFASQCISQYLK